MAWFDDYYLGSSDYPRIEADELQEDDPYFDPWKVAERDLDEEGSR
jgi:hypothetical protein